MAKRAHISYADSGKSRSEFAEPLSRGKHMVMATFLSKHGTIKVVSGTHSDKRRRTDNMKTRLAPGFCDRSEGIRNASLEYTSDIHTIPTILTGKHNLWME